MPYKCDVCKCVQGKADDLVDKDKDGNPRCPNCNAIMVEEDPAPKKAPAK